MTEAARLLEQDAAVVRTGASAAGAYGWHELAQPAPTWSLDGYLSVDAFSALQDQLNQLDIIDTGDVIERDSVLLRVVHRAHGQAREIDDALWRQMFEYVKSFV